MSSLKFSLWMFVGIFLAVFSDIMWDFYEDPHFTLHMRLEVLVAIWAIVAFAVLWRYSYQQHQTNQQLQNSLHSMQHSLLQSQTQAKKLVGELAAVIQQQFNDWNLTKSEKEIALLLLKGLSLEQIAAVRETGEETVRQHASNLYKKANLPGRHGLVAFFFQDLLKPSTDD